MIARDLTQHLKETPDVANLLAAEDASIKVFLGYVPQGVAFPAATIITIGGGPDYHLRGEIGEVQKIVQVSVFAGTFLECEAITEAIRLAISGYGGAFEQTAVLAVAVQNERDATIAPVDSSGRAGWVQSTDYRITFSRAVTAY